MAKITYTGGVYGNEALCYQGREILKQLKKRGHKINIVGPKVKGYWSDFYENFKGRGDLLLMNGHYSRIPDVIKEGYKKIINIAVSETHLPDSWVDNLNLPEIKEIWTISDFCADMIKQSGVKKPVKTIYLGLDKRFFKTNVNMFPKDNSFKFLNVSAPHCVGTRDRKGLDLLIRAFKEEFGDDPNFTLILKINSIYADNIYRKLGKNFSMDNYLKQFVPKGTKPGNIAVINQYMKIDNLNYLYNSVNCGVFPSRGEGFNLPAAEMIKIGLPVITTGWSAPIEFSDPNLQIKVPQLKNIDYPFEPYQNQKMAEPDLEHIKKLMRTVYDNYDKEKKKAERWSSNVARFDWDKIGEKIDILINNLS